MPTLERHSSPLFKLLETGLFISFPHYEASLPQEIDLTGKKVYLLHLDAPLKHARHYLGFSEDIQERVRRHRSGRGATFMRAIAKEGISWHVSRIWDGDRELERILKIQHNASHLCPTCIQKRIFERTLSIEVNPITHEKRPLRREARIQPSLWE
jgi:hypothetical protein